MYRVTSPKFSRAGRVVLAVAALAYSAVAAGVSQTGATCNAIALPTKVSERSSTDTYKSPNIEGGKRVTVFTFQRRSDPLRGRKIIDEDPSYAVALLSDGSKLSFDRDCRGVQCIYSGIKVAPKTTNCWQWLADGKTTTGRFALGQYRFITVRNARDGGHLILQTETGSWEVSEEPLIIGPNPIVGFGVGVPALHAPYRNIDVIRREKDGSLSLATYSFMYRSPLF